MVIEKICIERFLVAKTFGMNCSFQVETYGIEITSSGTSHAKSASNVEFSETNEEIDTKISSFKKPIQISRLNFKSIYRKLLFLILIHGKN